MVSSQLSLALHLKGAENEEKIENTIDMRIATLSTPNESVQCSVAECLALVGNAVWNFSVGLR